MVGGFEQRVEQGRNRRGRFAGRTEVLLLGPVAGSGVCGTVVAVKVLLVGDTHGNAHWWDAVVSPVAAQVEADAVVQVGDFGFWPGEEGRWFLDAVADTGVPVYFCDGNHEHHTHLAEVTAAARDMHSITDRTEPVPVGKNLWYLPRGGRVSFGPVRFCALGGAHSIDRPYRTPGSSWFAAEAVTDDDLAEVRTGGRCDVMLCHDAPSGWTIPGLPDVAAMPGEMQLEIPAANAHRIRIREAYEALQPSVVVHGHYHSRYRTQLTEEWGQVTVEGLDCDGTPGAFSVVECSAAPQLHTVNVTLR